MHSLLDHDQIAALWAGVVSDLEIARQEVTDHSALGERPDENVVLRMLSVLRGLRESTEQHQLIERIFRGSGSPVRALNRLEATIVASETMASHLQSMEPGGAVRKAGQARPIDQELAVSRRLAIKRAFDICGALLSLVLLAPLLFLTALATKLESPGPILFRQIRRGLGGRNFVIWKFRTMSVLEDGSVIVQAARRDQRVTKIGRLLRRSSIDELPQLLNVLKGEMSLVGPRPHALAHEAHFESLVEEYSNRYLFRPYITGWAQVNGCRGETSTLDALERRLELDLYYINNWSLGLDLKIIFKALVTSISDRNAF